MKRFNLDNALYNRRDYRNFYYIARLLERKGNEGRFIIFDRDTMKVLVEDWFTIIEDDFFECEYIYPGTNPYKVYAD